MPDGSLMPGETHGGGEVNEEELFMSRMA